MFSKALRFFFYIDKINCYRTTKMCLVELHIIFLLGLFFSICVLVTFFSSQAGKVSRVYPTNDSEDCSSHGQLLKSVCIVRSSDIHELCVYF